MPADDPGSSRERVVAQAGRLDAFVVAACPLVSRRIARRMIQDGSVRLNGRRVSRGAHVEAGDRVALPPIRLVPEPDLDVPLVHVDGRVVVVDKPGGVPGHALDPRQRGTVAGFLVAHFPDTAGIGDPLSSGLVHRLDTGTSGLQVAARTADTYARLRAAFRAGEVRKRYLAIVAGDAPSHAVVETALAHDPSDRRRMAAARPGLRAWPARTEVVRIELTGGRSLVSATLRSGVTHQVRVHLALLGCPIVGDRLYGDDSDDLAPGRHALHASALLPGPGVAALLPALESPLPPALGRLLMR